MYKQADKEINDSNYKKRKIIMTNDSTSTQNSIEMRQIPLLFVDSTSSFQDENNINFESVSETNSTCILPPTEVWPGKFNFSFKIEIDGCGDSLRKKSYFFSERLNKLFTKQITTFNVNFLTSNNVPNNCIIRALPFYISNDFQSTPVLRCIRHSQIDHNTNQNYLEHILRSNDKSTMYCRNNTSGRRSLTTFLKQNQQSENTVSYYFTCSTSCLRKMFKLIFTLESKTGEILGRQNLEIKVCSSPSRDINSEENKFEKNTNTNKVSYLNDEQLFWIPVRGMTNFKEVNLFAEYLDIGRKEYLSKDKVLFEKLKIERDILVNGYLINRDILLNTSVNT